MVLTVEPHLMIFITRHCLQSLSPLTALVSAAPNNCSLKIGRLIRTVETVYPTRAVNHSYHQSFLPRTDRER